MAAHWHAVPASPGGARTWRMCGKSALESGSGAAAPALSPFSSDGLWPAACSAVSLPFERRLCPETFIPRSPLFKVDLHELKIVQKPRTKMQVIERRVKGEDGGRRICSADGRVCVPGA